MGHETHEKDSYYFSIGTIGGRKNKYNSPSHGKPSKPPKQGKPSPQGGMGHSSNNNHTGQSQPWQPQGIGGIDNGHSQPLQQGAFLPVPGAYATPYPPPPYPNQPAVVSNNGDYHVQGNPEPFVPHQVGYGTHGGGHMNDVGLVGAAIGVATFGMFKLLRERRGYGGRH